MRGSLRTLISVSCLSGCALPDINQELEELNPKLAELNDHVTMLNEGLAASETGLVTNVGRLNRHVFTLGTRMMPLVEENGQLDRLSDQIGSVSGSVGQLRDLIGEAGKSGQTLLGSVAALRDALAADTEGLLVDIHALRRAVGSLKDELEVTDRDSTGKVGSEGLVSKVRALSAAIGKNTPAAKKETSAVANTKPPEVLLDTLGRLQTDLSKLNETIHGSSGSVTERLEALNDLVGRLQCSATNLHAAIGQTRASIDGRSTNASNKE